MCTTIAALHYADEIGQGIFPSSWRWMTFYTWRTRLKRKEEEKRPALQECFCRLAWWHKCGRRPRRKCICSFYQLSKKKIRCKILPKKKTSKTFVRINMWGVCILQVVFRMITSPNGILATPLPGIVLISIAEADSLNHNLTFSRSNIYIPALIYTFAHNVQIKTEENEK